MGKSKKRREKSIESFEKQIAKHQVKKKEAAKDNRLYAVEYFMKEIEHFEKCREKEMARLKKKKRKKK